MRFQGEIPVRYCRYPASELLSWTQAVKVNQSLCDSEKRRFDAVWMPHSPYCKHCELEAPYEIRPQQITRFYTGWVVSKMDLQRPNFHAWIERYKLLLPREIIKPNGPEGVGNRKFRELMDRFFPNKLDELRAIGKRLPFKSKSKVGIEAFNDPDVMTFCEETRKWGFYEVKNESEIRRRKIHTNQAASLGLLKDFFNDSADVAIIVNVAEGRSNPQVPLELRSYDFILNP